MCPSILEPIEQPKLSIMAWSGVLADIPQGWQLCDGTNGTPNLLDRFVRSVATDTTDPGATGGESTHVLTESEIPSHSHGVTESSHSHIHNDAKSETGIDGLVTARAGTTTDPAISSSNPLTSTSVGSTGSSTTHENKPAFFELAYIMRVN